ncbi:MAG: hypothetical protein JO092_00455, partial [Candidatus Eremiobacteraeota bacterium]|nr:hypothetical protein [Candidatus Eremiobacteraeota bacterium]
MEEGLAQRQTPNIVLHTLLFVGLAVVTVVIVVALVRALPRYTQRWPKLIEIAIGAVTNFFDTL